MAGNSDNCFVLDMVLNGFNIPFVDIPEAAHFKNNASAFQNYKFVNDSILDLVLNRFAIECNIPPKVVSPLSVSIQAGGKKRLIFPCYYKITLIFTNNENYVQNEIRNDVVSAAMFRFDSVQVRPAVTLIFSDRLLLM